MTREQILEGLVRDLAMRAINLCRHPTLAGARRACREQAYVAARYLEITGRDQRDQAVIAAAEREVFDAARQQAAEEAARGPLPPPREDPPAAEGEAMPGYRLPYKED